MLTFFNYSIHRIILKITEVSKALLLLTIKQLENENAIEIKHPPIYRLFLLEHYNAPV